MAVCQRLCAPFSVPVPLPSLASKCLRTRLLWQRFVKAPRNWLCCWWLLVLVVVVVVVLVVVGILVAAAVASAVVAPSTGNCCWLCCCKIIIVGALVYVSHYVHIYLCRFTHKTLDSDSDSGRKRTKGRRSKPKAKKKRNIFINKNKKDGAFRSKHFHSLRFFFILNTL